MRDVPATDHTEHREAVPGCDCQRELEHLLRSGVVREHTQGYQLLAYLGAKALNGSTHHLKEYVIGVEALHKPPNYDTRFDPTVRVEVGKLRRKLEEYYRGPGRNSPVRVVIPKGGYLPVYVRELATARPSRRHLLMVAPFAFALTLVAAVLVLRESPKSGVTPELEAFWGPHLTGRAPTLLVYGTPLFVKLNGTYFRDPHVNTAAEAAEHEKVQKVIRTLDPRENRPAFTFTGVGEAEGLFLLTRVLAAHNVALEAQSSASVNWEDMKGKHVVLLGGRKYNPLIPELPFKPKFEAVSRKIVNLQPQHGEASEYRTTSKTAHGEITDEYALVCVYPGLSSGTRLVILDSSSTEGTFAAAEFISRPDMIRELMAREVPLALKQDRVRPFQVVVGARFSKGVPVKVSYVTHVVLRDP